MATMRAFSVICLVACWTTVVVAFDCSFSSIYPRQYVAFKVSSDETPTIDGRLDDKAWTAVPFTDYFVDISNDAVPRYDTRAKMRWDDSWLYVGAELSEPQIWANLTEDETVIFYDNDFEIFVDPDGSNHYYKEFEMNALNKTWNLCLNKPYTDKGYENSTRKFGDKGWTMVPPLRCGVYVDGMVNNPTQRNRFWSVEVALPIKSLLYNQTQVWPGSANGTFWRINFSRVEYHVLVNDHSSANHSYHGYGYEKITGIAEDNWVWSPQRAVNMHLPERWAILQFSNLSDPSSSDMLYYDEWPIRSMAMSLYDAQRNYTLAANTSYTDDIGILQRYSDVPLGTTCLAVLPNITLALANSQVIGYVAVIENVNYTATITQDRYLRVYSRNEHTQPMF